MGESTDKIDGIKLIITRLGEIKTRNANKKLLRNFSNQMIRSFPLLRRKPTERPSDRTTGWSGGEIDMLSQRAPCSVMGFRWQLDKGKQIAVIT